MRFNLYVKYIAVSYFNESIIIKNIKCRNKFFLIVLPQSRQRFLSRWHLEAVNYNINFLNKIFILLKLEKNLFLHLHIYKYFIIILDKMIYAYYSHRKLEIIMTAQNNLPKILILNRRLLKYLMPCTEPSCRYSCKSWRAISLLFCTEWSLRDLILSLLNNSLFIFFGNSTWFTIILFTACCFFCETFDNILQAN